MKTIQIRSLEELKRIPPRAQSLELYLSDDEPLTAAHLDLLPASLHELSLDFRHTDDPSLAHIARRFTSLRELSLCTSSCSSLAPLASLKGLRTLDIRGGGAPPSGLASLTQLTSLTSNHDPASGIIEQLHKLTALQEFHIRDQHLSADLARALAALPALHTFRHGDGICYTRDPDALATLCTSSTLRHLALGGADAAPSPEEVASLRVAPSLQELTATFTDADQLRAIIPHLDHLDRLRLTLATQARRLTTPPTLIDAEMINLVASMTNIVALDIAQPHTYPAHHSTFAPDDLARLVALGRLEQLCITNLPPHITPPDLAWLTKLPALRSLSLGSATIGAKLADHLKGCKSLRTLCLQGANSPISGEVQFADGAFKKLSTLKLQALRVMNKRPISPISASHLASIPTLRVLELGELQEAAIAAFADHPTLERLKARVVDTRDNALALATLGAPPALWRLQLDFQYGHQQKLDASTVAALRAMPSLLNVNHISEGAHLLAGRALATKHSGHVTSSSLDEAQ